MSKYNNYTLRFNLTGFIGSRVVEIEDADGRMERGVFIPISINALYEDEKTKHVLCEAFVNAKTHNLYDSKTHYLKQKTSVAHVAKLDELGYKIPNLGGMWLNTRYQPAFQLGATTGNRVKHNQE